MVRTARAQSEWPAPDRPSFVGTWNVSMRVKGRKQSMLSTGVALCADCLAVPVGTNPSLVRPDCACVKKAAAWAVAEGKLRFKAVIRGEQEEARKPKSRMKWDEVFTTYEKHGPEDSKRRLNKLRMVLERPTGKRAEDLFIEDWTPAQVRLWAQLYQEYDRRGWTKPGAAPVDAWETLRGLGAALPPLDYQRMSPANRTIRSVLGDIKSILGDLSRGRYLLPLEGRLPEIPWLEKLSLNVPAPDTRVGIEPEAYKAMWQALPKLKEEDVKAWLALRIYWVTGIRPVEQLCIREDWLEVDEAGRVWLVVKNRPALPLDRWPVLADGSGRPDLAYEFLAGEFKLKAWRSAQVRALELPADVVEVIDEVKEPGWSIFGHRCWTHAEKLQRRVNGWIRQFVPEGAHASYLLRKNALTVRAAVEDVEAARLMGGHSDRKTTEGYYIDPKSTSRQLTDEELAPKETGRRLRMQAAS